MNLKLLAVLLVFVLLMGCSGSAAADCKLIANAVLPVTYIDEHIPVVTVQIGGQDVRMMVDTGSEASFISEDLYARLHLSISAHDDYTSSGLGGTIRVQDFVLQDIQIGAAKVHQEVLGVSNQMMPQIDGKPEVDGIMGYDMLQFFDIGLDLPDNKIGLYTSDHCTVGSTPWNGDFLPMTFTQPHGSSPAIQETVDDRSANVTIDTGAYRSMLTIAWLRGSGVKAEAVSAQADQAAGVGDKEFRIERQQFAAVVLGAEQFSDSWLDVDMLATEVSADSDGLLGEDYLAHHRVFIANSNATAYLGLTVQ